MKSPEEIRAAREIDGDVFLITSDLPAADRARLRAAFDAGWRAGARFSFEAGFEDAIQVLMPNESRR